MKFRALIAALLAVALSCAQANAAATLLPPGEQCFQATTGVNGMVGVLGTITGGSSYTNGTYAGVSLTGGSGSSATANITVSGGVVTAVTVLNPGTQYVVADVLSAAAANIGGTGSGFSVPVSSTAINSSLAGGTVSMYQPNTSIFKQTWFNADQSAAHQNTNPVTLDANGCAVIYGTGTYRQVLKDSLGNTVWDKTTADTSANNNTFWAGTAAGTPNVITVVDPGFNGTDGSVIQFIPIATNTGPTTLNPSGFGAISIVKDTTTGAVPLAGGEIVAGGPSNIVNVVYSASQANFHILNLVTQSSAQTSPTLCGATGLKIVNDAVLPNSKVNITADQVTMTGAAATVVSRSSVSLSINFSNAGANGLDTGVFAANTFYYIYVIDTGSAVAALGSASSTAPTMPSGYSYKCRLGTVVTNPSTQLFSGIQAGNRYQYVVNSVTSPTHLLAIATGPAGSYSISAPTYANATVTGLVPPTASTIVITASGRFGGLTASRVLVAPNTAYSGVSSGNPPPIATDTTLSNDQITFAMVLESTNVAWVADATGGAILCAGWIDKVNAN